MEVSQGALRRADFHACTNKLGYTAIANEGASVPPP
jgi:hypothetical protein